MGVERYLAENTERKGLNFFEEQPVMSLEREGEEFVDRIGCSRLWGKAFFIFQSLSKAFLSRKICEQGFDT